MARYAKITKIKINSQGVAALMKGPEVTGNLRARGARVQAALPTGKGEEWDVVNLVNKDRSSVMIRTANYQARKTSARINALVNALSAGR